MANIVAIVGRPNVGKSTLFNRLTGTRRAIVMNTAGTTRDRQYGKADWCGREFSVIDTGGWVVNSDDTFESEINRQVDLAIREADVVLLVVDVNEGVTQFDTEVAHLLRQAKKPTILAVNKVDTFENQYGAAESLQHHRISIRRRKDHALFRHSVFVLFPAGSGDLVFFDPARPEKRLFAAGKPAVLRMGRTLVCIFDGSGHRFVLWLRHRHRTQ